MSGQCCHIYRIIFTYVSTTGANKINVLETHGMKQKDEFRQSNLGFEKHIIVNFYTFIFRGWVTNLSNRTGNSIDVFIDSGSMIDIVTAKGGNIAVVKVTGLMLFHCKGRK